MSTKSNFIDDVDYKAKETWFGFKNNDRPFLEDDEGLEEPVKENKNTIQTSGLSLSSFKSPKYSSLVDHGHSNISHIDITAMDKITSESKPSFYFKPYPEGKIINDGILNKRVVPIKKGYLLPNGNNCKVLKVDGVAVSITQTCPFDSVMQILQFGALDYPQYTEAIQASNNKALKFLTNFLKGGISTFVLKERILILKNIYPMTRCPDAISVSPYYVNAQDSIGGI